MGESSVDKNTPPKKKKKTKIDMPFSEIKKAWLGTTTTKKWGILSWGMAIILTDLLVFGTFFTSKDMSTFVIIVGSSWAEVAAYNAVYAWKSKCENKLKITYDCVERLADRYGIDAITPIL